MKFSKYETAWEPLSERANHTLDVLGCRTRHDLAAYHYIDPLRVKGCGRKTYQELLAWLDDVGLEFSNVGC